jgi:prophage regulatory protein
VRQTSVSKRPAAQVAFAKKGADAKAAKNKTNPIAPDLIDGNGQEVAEEALAGANRPAREHDERSLHAGRAPPAPLGARLLSKREVLEIVSVSYPTLWSMMRAGTFPRSRVVGGKSMWLSSEIEAWLAALPVRQLKGDEPSGPVHDDRKPRLSVRGSQERKVLVRCHPDREQTRAARTASDRKWRAKVQVK